MLASRAEKRDNTAKGILAFFLLAAAYCAIYALSYPLTAYTEQNGLTFLFTDPGELVNVALTAAGLGLAALKRDSLRPADWAAGLGLGAVVWAAVEAKYLYNGWTPIIPYYDPTLHGLETFAMVMGAIAILKSHDVLSFKLAAGKRADAAKSLAIGAALGLPLAIANVLIFVFVYQQTPVLQNVPYECLIAVQPGIVEEVAYRLFLLSAALVLLRRYFGHVTATALAIFVSVVFHAALHVPELLVTSPLAALAVTAFMSAIFGLPMALLAYKRDVETAIGFHWAIDALRFSLGL
jgi:hypothetical protein